MIQMKNGILGIVSACLIAGIALPPLQAAAQSSGNNAWSVKEQDVDDLKAVFATVRSKDRIEARVRTPGTVVTLKADEGAHVEEGQVLAIVADPKIALKMRALDAQIIGAESRVATAKLEFERADELRKRGVTPQARVDQFKTAFDVATNEVKSLRAERLVAEQQVTEGQVLAPAAGRIIKVPVTTGSVVMAGESVATIAANQYLLRLELPERHARFIRKGDPVKIGARGLSPDQQIVSEGKIIQVYPELQSGRVIADAEVAGLGDYFVGERAQVWISAGKRKAIVVPTQSIFTRSGIDYVRVVDAKGVATEVVVQTGRTSQLADKNDGIEILSGLKPGDEVVRTTVKQ